MSQLPSIKPAFTMAVVGMSHANRLIKTDAIPSQCQLVRRHAYVLWLSRKTGETYRLPMSDEWERFAGTRASKKPTKLFDDPRMAWAADYANYGTRPAKTTKPVSQYNANQAGCTASQKMSGNGQIPAGVTWT